MGVGTKELMKMMEQGQLVASDFLPKFSKELSKAARMGGALAAGLNTSRVAMGRFKNSFEANVLESFEAGTEEGMSFFFNQLTEVMKNLAPTFRLVGKAVGGLLATLGYAVRLITQLLRPFTMLLDKIFGDKLQSQIKDVNGELKETRDLVDGLSDAFSFLAGVIALPFGILERALNQASDSWDAQAQGAADRGHGKLGQLFFGQFGEQIDAVKDLFGNSTAQAQSSSGTTTKVDNRSFTSNITVADGNPEVIRNVVDEHMQIALTQSY